MSSVAGSKIRPGLFADVPAIAKVHVEAFIETHGGGDAPRYPLRLVQWSSIFSKDDGRWFCFVIEREDGEIVGFAKGDLPLEGTNGLLNKIYILRKHHGIGLGRCLLFSVAEEFLKRGFTEMHLFGEADNPSNGFYEHLGAEKTLAENGDFHGGYRWNDLHALVALAD